MVDLVELMRSPKFPELEQGLQMLIMAGSARMASRSGRTSIQAECRLIPFL
jgi:hypothetical protein